MRHRPAIQGAIGKILAAVLLWTGAPLLAASYLDTNGFTALRLTTANLNGSGVTVAQIEGDATAGTTQWEVNPAATNVLQPSLPFFYYSSNGVATVFPNTVGTESPHADNVASYYYGQPAGEATNLAAVNNYEADFFYTEVLNATFPTNFDSPVANQSFNFNNVSNNVAYPLTASQQESVDSEYDDYAAQFNTLFISGVGNGGQVNAPATSYDGLGVGAYDGGSSTGPTIDNGRGKPDITATADATSFSTPQVSGAAAVLLQAALRGDGGSATNAASDMRTLKALLLNGAVKPAGWTNSSVSPLDARYGAGLVNIFNSYTQLAGGQHAYIATSSVAIGAAHPPTGASGTVNAAAGWDYNTITSSSTSDAVNHYYFNVTNPVLSATLVWNRQRNQTAINYLALFLYNAANSNLVGACTSAVDNVQHLFLGGLPAGRYDLQVFKGGGTMFLNTNVVSNTETYALAFDFFRVSLAQARSGADVVLTWPLHPAGLWLGSAASLNPPVAWTPVNLTPPVSNGQYRVVVPVTAGNQFFELRQP